ncbi:MAG: hypothetical protein JXB49_01130 [Bacteroidales bacterium]|nr:hypothetical protein [Bacteroidales bacterium]
MELIELKNMWREYDRKIVENTRLNKEILRRILVLKPERRLNWMKMKAILRLFSPIILLVPLLFLNFNFQFSLHFIIGLILFLVIITTTYIWDIKYFLLIRKIDFSDAILTIKKGITKLEKYKIKTTRIRFILAPVAILGIFFMLIQKPVFNKESIIFLGLVVLVFIASVYYTFKYSIYERFRLLNKEIKEIENMGK